jgi:hypothetical protein
MRYAGESGSNACCSVEPYYYDWYETAPGCSGYDDYDCGYVEVETPVCPAGGNCNKAVFHNCDPEANCEDNDGDGYFGGGPLCINGTDCDDENANINPGKAEICGSEDANGERVDENCNDLKDCEEESCRNKKGVDCSEQCDKDGDTYYSEDCDGIDCKDNPETESNASFIYPGSDEENTKELCSDEKNNDCDGDVDCDDSDCAEMEHCQDEPTPTPTPDPGGGGDDCPCNDCVIGCNGGGGDDDPVCNWVTVEGQCYGGIEGGCVDNIDYYSGNVIGQTCWETEPPYCDPDETIYVCTNGG